MEPPEEDLDEALRRRARQAAGDALVRRARLAIEAAQEAVSRARVLSGARRLARDPDALAKRCAWCGRFVLGEKWLEPVEMERVVASPDGTLPQVSHTICPDCTERLVREHRSH